MKKIRINDEVVILTGKDKKKRGIVKKIIDINYVIVDKINVFKKTIKPNPSLNKVGNIIEKIMPIHVSNIALFNPKLGKADRVIFKNINGKKIRVFKTNNEIVNSKSIKI
ncbi:50S ribosomal protein L24 [Candidatus Profftella armatura]|uniref:Large ribosomal subunit protein uL24 n=1 Tax=Candidatus Profftella armatura TaxID=669502 RepID=S5R0L1_9PROT|nr:50S ribosomal protein L24 [Candidatus Profftella armatura]AGS06737.1 50S ribosomal protein L24 [Candidatus Profftella armatura]ALC95856.1 50S ribosomal protein L24 [Candidatus Profftella armatura]QLK13651.1 50S ribosomal protein L24 [Candidatus Profftella armatura]